MLSGGRIEDILAKLPQLTIGVLGDLFLDQYLRLDPALTEPSLETRLDAYQVVEITNSPGAAGTVLNNLVALGVGQVKILSFIGIDGQGYDLMQELILRGVDLSDLLESPHRRTPTYIKPMLGLGTHARELNRLDINNRTPTPGEVESFILDKLPRLWSEVDALLVIDQVSEAECGVVTTAVRERLSKLGRTDPRKMLLADSRVRIGAFHFCWAKPNLHECQQAVKHGLLPPGEIDDWEDEARFAASALADQLERPVFCTLGENGSCLADPFAAGNSCSGQREVGFTTIDQYPVAGPIDVVGAGDSTSASIACAYAAGASLTEAAAFGNLVASITIQQLGTTGTATPDMVRARWREIDSQQVRS
jgi:bifunctional ADP-heptose synthase (sugar kinase/adenylyltransferase)